MIELHTHIIYICFVTYHFIKICYEIHRLKTSLIRLIGFCHYMTQSIKKLQVNSNILILIYVDQVTYTTEHV